MATAGRGQASDRPPLDNTTAVDTPERVRFRYHVAGPSRRAAAWGLDFGLRTVILGGAFFILMLAAGGEANLTGVATGIWFVVMFVAEWGYHVLFETLRNGRTPGKWALGLRVVKEGGYPINFIDSVLRNLLRFADLLPFFYVAGLLSMVGDRRFRRLGDRVAATMVVIEDPVRVQQAPTLSPPPAEGELERFPSRPPLSPPELEAIDMLLRRADLSPPRRQELADMVAPVFARRMGMTVRAGESVRFLGLLHLRAQPRIGLPPAQAPARNRPVVAGGPA